MNVNLLTEIHYFHILLKTAGTHRVKLSILLYLEYI